MAIFSKNNATILAAGVAALSAITSAWLAYRSNISASKISTKTQAAIAELDDKRAKALAQLDDERERAIAEAQTSIAKAQIFRDLITQLSQPETSTLALLALWQLYPQRANRKILLLAALSTPNPQNVKTLVSLDEQLEPYLDTLQKARESDDPVLSRAASEVITNLTPDQETLYNLKILDKAQEGDIDAFNESVAHLVSLAQTHNESRRAIEKASTEWQKNILILHYILYQAGRTDELMGFIINNEPTEQNFAKIEGIVCCGTFKDDDEDRIVDFVVRHIEISKNPKPLAFSIMYDRGPWRKGKAFLSKYRDRVASSAEKHFMNRQHEKGLRKRALYTLSKWAPKRALHTISKVMAEGESNASVRNEIAVILEEGAEPGLNSLRDGFPKLAIPGATDNEVRWSEWKASNASFLESSQ